jgi:hypothetical protein
MVGIMPQLFLENVSYADEYTDITVPPFFATLDNGSESVINIKPDLKTDGVAITRVNL